MRALILMRLISKTLAPLPAEQFLTRLSELTGRNITFEEVDGTATVDDAVVCIVAKLSKEYKLALVSNAPSKLIRGILEHER
jgi:hypothetical protein